MENKMSEEILNRACLLVGRFRLTSYTSVRVIRQRRIVSRTNPIPYFVLFILAWTKTNQKFKPWDFQR